MDVHGFSWIFMDFYGFTCCSRIFIDFMDFHGFSWIFIDCITTIITTTCVQSKEGKVSRETKVTIISEDNKQPTDGQTDQLTLTNRVQTDQQTDQQVTNLRIETLISV